MALNYCFFVPLWGYEGGEVQFFDRWGARRPVASYKCAAGCGIAFCGCHKNIHAVTGVKRGFRLVLLIWTRPPGVLVPGGQDEVCYFRPGTGNSCWLHTAEIRRGLARRGRHQKLWEPDEDFATCNCTACREERCKISWKESWMNIAERFQDDKKTMRWHWATGLWNFLNFFSWNNTEISYILSYSCQSM